MPGVGGTRSPFLVRVHGVDALHLLGSGWLLGMEEELVWVELVFGYIQEDHPSS